LNLKEYIQSIADKEFEYLPGVTRFEVIDEQGRAYTRHGVDVRLSFQDDGRTLKVFIDKPKE
jgi:hypothetical protein